MWKIWFSWPKHQSNLKSCDYLLGWSPDEGLIEKFKWKPIGQEKKLVTYFILTQWYLVCDIPKGHIYGITNNFWFWKPIGQEKYLNWAKKPLKWFCCLIFMKICIWMQISWLIMGIMSKMDLATRSCYYILFFWVLATFFNFYHYNLYYSFKWWPNHH